MPRSPQPFAFAICAMLLAIVLYDVMGAIVKDLRADYTTQQLTEFRNLFGLVPAGILLMRSRSWIAAGRPLVIRQWPLAVLRGIIGVCAQLSFYLALIHMDLATATTLVFAGPLFVTALSWPILGHVVGWLRWGAVVLGFGGVVLVLGPNQGEVSWTAFLPVLAALGYGCTAVTAKLFDDDVPTPLVSLYYTLTALLAAVILTIWTGGFAPVIGSADWAWLAMMGCVGGLAAFFMTSANRMADPSSLSPFQYFGIPSSFLLGWMFFSEAPFDDLIPGVFLIIAGGLIIVARERQLGKAPPAPLRR